jgi:putative N6-adenine-specific DNA methylase
MTDRNETGVNEKAIARRVKDHVIGGRHDFFAVVQPGFEETAGWELRRLGISDFKPRATGGIEFTAKLNDAYRVNLGAGTVSRLLLRLFHFKATGFGEFCEKMTAWPWELHLKDKTRVSFSISTGRSRLWHKGRLLQETEKAVRKRLAIYGREITFNQIAGETNAGEQAIFVRLDQNRCQVSLDSSGGLLYQRGYGKYTERAPLRETLACCILRAACIDRYQILIDPFCGSGTFSLEAGLIFSGRPCNLHRNFAFQNWPSFRPAAYRHLKEQLTSEFKIQEPAGIKRIFCSDISEKAVHTTTRNLAVTGLESLTEVRQADFFRIRPPAVDPARVLLVLNPPYGMRLGGHADIPGFYRRIGEKIRRDFKGCGYAIIVPGLELEKRLSLPHDQKILFRNGGLPVSVLIKHGFSDPANHDGQAC